MLTSCPSAQFCLDGVAQGPAYTLNAGKSLSGLVFTPLNREGCKDTPGEGSFCWR